MIRKSVRRIVGLVALALAITIAVVGWLRSETTTPIRSASDVSPPPGTALPSDAETTRTPPATTEVGEYGTRPPPLPADDAPVAAVIDQLQARADAGDRAAACRLGAELVLCSHLEGRAEGKAWGSGEVASPPSSMSGDDRVQWVAGQQWRQARLAECRALPAVVKARGAHYLRQAALAGEPEAMRRYALGEHLAPYRNDFLTSPFFDEWLREAPGLAERALRGGDPAVIAALLNAYRTDGGLPFHGLIADDPGMERSFMLLQARLAGRTDSRGSRLSAREEADAEARAAMWHRIYFQDERLTRQPTRAPRPLDFLAMQAQAPSGLCRPRTETGRR